MDLLKYITLGILALFGIYVVSRLVSYAVSKSYFQVKQNHQQTKPTGGEKWSGEKRKIKKL